MSERFGDGNQEGRNQQGELVIQIRDNNEREIFTARGSVHIVIDPGHGAQHHTEEPQAEQVNSDRGTEEKQRIQRHMKLHQAAVNGDWTAAKMIFDEHPEDINAKINVNEETALHIAIMTERTYFVKKLVKIMSDAGLTCLDVNGYTALFAAVATGKMEFAEAIINKKEDLVTIRCGSGSGSYEGMLPVYAAVDLGHKEMARYLYRKTKRDLIKEDERRDLLVAMINADMYDIAFKLINEVPVDFVFANDRNRGTALDALARKPHILSKADHWSKCFNLFPGSNNVADQITMRRWARRTLKVVWEQTVLNGDRITDVVGKYFEPIFVAVEQGNTEFLRILLRSWPDLVIKTNENKQHIFHAAVVFRQEEIFKLIHETALKKKIVACCDMNGNNMLHLAGELPPSDRLNLVPGPAFQLQRELQWFEEVKKVVGPLLAKRKTQGDSPKTPQEIFIKAHDDLFKKGEEWMRNTANYCMIVATLVATVAFAAAYTVPGGNDQNTGFPMFLHKLAFKIFAVADAVSLVSSASSVIIFLSLLTSTYALEDFVWSLPNKLVIGLACLFIALLAMMVAFVSAFFIYFKKRQLLLGYAVPVASAACIPIGLFIWSHKGLIVGVFESTYRSKKLFRPNHNHPVFQAAEVK